MINDDTTPRDLFAGLAMQPLLADRSRSASIDALAVQAFSVADAMLRARGTPPQATRPARQGCTAT